MSTKDIKELARMTMGQCREKLITLIKECGDMDNLNFRIKLQTDEFDDVATITSIKNGVVHYEVDDEEYDDDISEFTTDELYEIIIFL